MIWGFNGMARVPLAGREGALHVRDVARTRIMIEAEDGTDSVEDSTRYPKQSSQPVTFTCVLTLAENGTRPECRSPYHNC